MQWTEPAVPMSRYRKFFAWWPVRATPDHYIPYEAIPVRWLQTVHTYETPVLLANGRRRWMIRAFTGVPIRPINVPLTA